MKLTGKHIIATVACFALFVLITRPWQLYFLNDDFMHIPMDNRWLFLRGGFMRPVPNIFVMFDKMLYGKNALGFYVTTMMLQFAATCTVYLLVKEVLLQYAKNIPAQPTALATAALFLFYPFHAESVMWVIARVSIIATFFTLTSFWLYIRSANSTINFILSVLCFVIALFTYESVWNATLVFAIISWRNIADRKLPLRKEIYKLAVLVTVFAAYLLFRVVVLKTLAGDGYLEVNENLQHVTLLLTNLLKLFARIYTPPFHSSVVAVAAFILLSLLFLLLCYVVAKRNKRNAAFILILWLLVLTGVVTASPLGINTHNNEADRYLYYASFFFCFLLAITVVTLAKASKVKLVIAGICLLFVSALFAIQKRYAFASAVTRTTVEAIQRNVPFRHGYFVDVPASYEGALIFRICLPNAIEWMAPGIQHDSITVVSQQEFFEKSMPYKYQQISWKDFAKVKGWNSSDAIINGKKMQPGDAVYWFTPHALYRVVLP